LQDTVAIFVEEAEHPKINELETIVYCVLDQVTIVSKPEALRKPEKMEESLYY
jgi:hypothetical protein